MHILDSPIQLLTHLFIHSHILLFTHFFIYSHIHTYLLNWPLHLGHCRESGERWIGSVWKPGLSALAKGIGQTYLPSPIHLCSAGGSQAKCFSNIDVCMNHLGILLNERFCFSSYGWGLLAQSLWSCSTLCNPMDCSLPGSFVHGILRARIMKWVVMASSKDLPEPGIEPRSSASSALQVDSLPWRHWGVLRCSISDKNPGKTYIACSQTTFFFQFNLNFR